MQAQNEKYDVGNIMRLPVTIQHGVTLKGALQVLIEKKSNMACVINDEGVLMGDVTTLDVIRAILPHYVEEDVVAAKFADADMLVQDAKKAADKPLSDFIDTHPTTITPDTQILEATVLLARSEGGRIVVVDEERRPIGILTRTEIKQVLGSFLGIKTSLF